MEQVGDRIYARLEMHVQAAMEQGWISTGRQLIDGVPRAETYFLS
jgi:hypothetical protein